MKRAIRTRSGFFSRALLALIFVIPIPPAHASLRAVAPDATAVIDTLGVSAALDRGDFCVLAWLKAEDAGVPSEILSFQNNGIPTLTLEKDANGTVVAALGQGGEQVTLSAGALSAGVWTLVALSIEQRNSTATLWVAAEGAPIETAHSPIGEVIDPSARTVRLGAVPGGATMLGTYGLVAVRYHALTEDMVVDIAASTDFLHAYNLPDGGGGENVAWMIGQTLTTLPQHALGYSSSSTQRSAPAGGAMTIYNSHIHDERLAGNNALNVVRSVVETSGFEHVTPFGDGHFLPALLDEPEWLPSSLTVAAWAPRARRLTGPPQGLLRVMVSANSRGIQRNDGTAARAGNYADGFLHTLEDHAAGVLLRPAVTGRHSWFTFSTSSTKPWTSGTVYDLTNLDFSRFFTGATATSSPGPGAGVGMLPGSGYALRANPRALMTWDAPLVVRAHVLAYPGAADLSWTPNRSWRQNNEGQDDQPPTTIQLDSTNFTTVFDPASGDVSIPGFLYLSDPQVSAQVNPGDACAHSNGVSVVESVSPHPDDPALTVVNLHHPFKNAPVMGDTIAFGSWEIVTIEHEFPPVDPISGLRWRGLKLESSMTGWPVAVFAFDAWNPEADGFVFGSAGWGGNGYRAQIDQSHPGAIEAWASATNADIWLQGFAQQDSEPETMLDFTTLVRTGLPDAEVLWIGETEHGTGTAGEWHRYILENARANGIAAISLLHHPGFGTNLEQMVAGYRSNSNHYSGAGADALAAAWLDLLAEAALASIADLNADGAVDASDLAALLAAWGPCEGACPADLDASGAVDAADLAILLADWG